PRTVRLQDVSESMTASGCRVYNRSCDFPLRGEMHSPGDPGVARLFFVSWLSHGSRAEFERDLFLKICVFVPGTRVGFGRRSFLIQIALRHERERVSYHQPSFAQGLTLAVHAGKIQQGYRIPARFLSVKCGVVFS